MVASRINTSAYIEKNLPRETQPPIESIESIELGAKAIGNNITEIPSPKLQTRINLFILSAGFSGRIFSLFRRIRPISMKGRYTGDKYRISGAIP